MKKSLTEQFAKDKQLFESVEVDKTVYILSLVSSSLPDRFNKFLSNRFISFLETTPSTDKNLNNEFLDNLEMYFDDAPALKSQILEAIANKQTKFFKISNDEGFSIGFTKESVRQNFKEHVFKDKESKEWFTK